MSELMKPIAFENLLSWIFKEYEAQGSIFGVRKQKFYQNKSGKVFPLFGENLASPIGPAAGPHSQLTQNIVAAYLAGSRFIELKTVQIMDGDELRRCVPRPCIHAEDEGYNVEWSTELTVSQAFDEYVKAWFLLHVLGKELGLSPERDFAFNMSVGYTLEGIQSPKIDRYIEDMKDAADTQAWNDCYDVLQRSLSRFRHFTQEDLDSISPGIATSITLSTLHGCPKEEIERIARYLLTEKHLHTYVKCNPTLLGYEQVRETLDTLGFGYIAFGRHHFENDLQFEDAVAMMERLLEEGKAQDLAFGVKLTNTFPVQITGGELPGEEMYMSGRALFPLSIYAAQLLSEALQGRLPISYSGGADYFNIAEILKTGIGPVTLATTLLKPGGYERLRQIAEKAEATLAAPGTGRSDHLNVKALSELAAGALVRPHNIKSYRPVKTRKMKAKLPLFDCFTSPCNESGCPIRQQIPLYLELVSRKQYEEAFAVIAQDNTCPAILGTICNHECQGKCTRLDYDTSLQIRNMKALAVHHGQAAYLKNIEPTQLKTDKKAVVIGAGPAGIAAALFLRRNGVDVTVLEKREQPYGMVRYVIPEFRIHQELIEKDYEMARRWGVRFQFGIPERYSLSQLKREYDYVVLATGAWGKGHTPVKSGEELLLDALAFLEEAKENNLELDLGETVAVIGGGDVAMDCARTAKRVPGVKRVALVYRRTKEFMPALTEEIEMALKDGVDLIELMAPERYNGNILDCQVMALDDSDVTGRRGVAPTGEEKALAFDTVISAVGAVVDTGLFKENGLELTEKGKVKTNENNESSIEGVYVAGDCKAGSSNIANAVADGKLVAADILRKLGLPCDFEEEYSARFAGRGDEASLYAKKGILQAPLSEEKEGSRCLGCDQICELCCDVCPNRANVAVTVGAGGFRQKHQILHIDALCNECGNCAVFCPYNGRPYKDKVTLFSTWDDLEESDSIGFLRFGDNRYLVRREDGSVYEYTRGGDGISEELKQMIEAVFSEDAL